MNQWFDFERVAFRDIAVHENDGWVCNMCYSALFHFDMSTLDMNFVTELPAKNVTEYELYGPIEYYEGKLIIAPIRGTDILIYDINTGSFRQIPVDKMVDVNCVNLFQKIIICGTKAYFIPGRSHNILCLNLENYSMESVIGIYDLVADKGYDKIRWLISDAYRDGNVIYMPSWQSNKIITLDCVTDTVNAETFGAFKAFSSCRKFRDALYVTARDTQDILIIKKENATCVRVVGPEKFLSERGIRSIFFSDEKALIIPYKGNMILETDLYFEHFDEYMSLPIDYADEILRMYPDNFSCCKQLGDGRIVLYSLFEGRIAVLDMKNKTYNFKDTSLNETDYAYVKKYFSDKKYENIVRETRGTGLNQFLEYISNI